MTGNIFPTSMLPNWMRGSIKPDFIIGSRDNPYLLRWYITPWSGCCRKNKNGDDIEFASATLWQKFVRTLPNIYLHKIIRDDDDRALHDHPWASVSVILKGGFWEVMKYPTIAEVIFGKTEEKYFAWRQPGRAYFRRATAMHRLELATDLSKVSLAVLRSKEWPKIPCWSLFLTGPRLREWGFHCPKGWIHWRIFTTKHNHGEVGQGCGEA